MTLLLVEHNVARDRAGDHHEALEDSYHVKRCIGGSEGVGGGDVGGGGGGERGEFRQ